MKKSEDQPQSAFTWSIFCLYREHGPTRSPGSVDRMAVRGIVSDAWILADSYRTTPLLVSWLVLSTSIIWMDSYSLGGMDHRLFLILPKTGTMTGQIPICGPAS